MSNSSVVSMSQNELVNYLSNSQMTHKSLALNKLLSTLSHYQIMV